ncbi:phosphotransferase [Lentzea sp. DG1S-22]|uniref:phosphotransferase family protein n=1 Tax=Lentzea sp. DG1S-22 TaxID=3108822 RepID=UPI002E7668E3|nr:phosphotransferase [Lentzea sp. DG1S-22]WVH84754.1 phosphotransferase [Lentzea sp. DG1S-22]
MIEAEDASAGRNSAVAASLMTAGGWIFCKGIKADDRQAFMHRNEAAVNPFLPRDVAPRLLWQVENDGWLLLGFEHVSGQHADYSPNSPDLPLVAKTVQVISQTEAPTIADDRRAIQGQWAAALDQELALAPPDDAHSWSRENALTIEEWARRAPSYLGGSALIHSDLNPFNVLVADRAQVVDWAWWKTGPAWVDAAHLVVRLVAAGHSPAEAEAWAAQFDGFGSVERDGITAFAASLVRLWERKFAGTEATDAAVRWLEHRLNSR